MDSVKAAAVALMVFLVTAVVLLLIFGGSAAIVVGFLYAVWTGEWVGAQVALTGLAAMALGVLAAFILEGQ